MGVEHGVQAAQRGLGLEDVGPFGELTLQQCPQFGQTAAVLKLRDQPGRVGDQPRPDQRNGDLDPGEPEPAQQHGAIIDGRLDPRVRRAEAVHRQQQGDTVHRRLAGDGRQGRELAVTEPRAALGEQTRHRHDRLHQRPNPGVAAHARGDPMREVDRFGVARRYLIRPGQHTDRVRRGGVAQSGLAEGLQKAHVRGV